MSELSAQFHCIAVIFSPSSEPVQPRERTRWIMAESGFLIAPVFRRASLDFEARTGTSHAGITASDATSRIGASSAACVDSGLGMPTTERTRPVAPQGQGTNAALVLDVRSLSASKTCVDAAPKLSRPAWAPALRETACRSVRIARRSLITDSSSGV